MSREHGLYPVVSYQRTYRKRKSGLSKSQSLATRSRYLHALCVQSAIVVARSTSGDVFLVYYLDIKAMIEQVCLKALMHCQWKVVSEEGNSWYTRPSDDSAKACLRNGRTDRTSIHHCCIHPYKSKFHKRPELIVSGDQVNGPFSFSKCFFHWAIHASNSCLQYT